MINYFNTRALLLPRCHNCREVLSVMERKHHRSVCYACVATESYASGGELKERRFLSCMRVQSERRAQHFSALRRIASCQ